MSIPVYVTEVSEREPQFRGGIEMQIPLWSDIDNETSEWWANTYGIRILTFPTFRSEGRYLFDDLCIAIQKRDEEAINRLIPEIEKYTIKNHMDKTEPEKWGDMAIQLPDDWGPQGDNKLTLKQMMTNLAYGRIMEPMCGFRSYFGESDRITEVVALDFCEEALERYDYPERKRILYDLERIVKGEKMDFFEDGTFDTIGVFFAIDYITEPIPVKKEFYRLLSADGQLLIVGGTTQGYSDILKRNFDPEECSAYMNDAGFVTKVTELPLKEETDVGSYFLVEGRK